MKILLIINPSSGKMKVKQNIFDIIETLSTKYDEVAVRLTKHRLHATQIIAESDLSQYDTVACCGGDGTLNEVINGIVKSGKNDTTIGYIPSGSTNDFANSIGIPTNPIEASRLICSGKARSIDLGLFAGEKSFTYIASFGVFTAVSYNTRQSFKNIFGHLAYVLEGIKDIANIKTYKVKTMSDGKLYSGEYIFGAVTNSTSIGGIVHLPQSNVDFSDGLFEVILIKKPVNPNDLAKIIFGITNSKFDSEVFDFFKTAEVNFEFDNPIVWSLDGEACASDGNVEIKAEQKAINIILQEN